MQLYTKLSSLDNIEDGENRKLFSGDYSDLTNAPTIPSKTSDLTNDSGYIDDTYHDTTKQDTLISGSNIKTINNIPITGSGNIDIDGGGINDINYNNINNKPSINGVELIGNKTTNDLGIEIPTKLSDLENDGYFITIKTGERRWSTYAEDEI